MAEPPRESGKESNGPPRPHEVHEVGVERSAPDRLNRASNIVVAVMAVFATVISLIALHMQSQDRAIAAQDRAAAARKAQAAFANRIVPIASSVGEDPG